MQVVHAQENDPIEKQTSIFLVGPTPRSQRVSSWRSSMIAALEVAGFNGVVFSPEPRNGQWQGEYLSQVKWEIEHLNLCDLIVAWIPRILPEMPALTTNVEFGMYISSGKLIYGRPDWSEKNKYLDWLYKEMTGRDPANSIESIANIAVDLTKNIT